MQNKLCVAWGADDAASLMMMMMMPWHSDLLLASTAHTRKIALLPSQQKKRRVHGNTSVLFCSVQFCLMMLLMGFEPTQRNETAVTTTTRNDFNGNVSVVNAKRQFTTANVIVNVNAQQRQTSWATSQAGLGNILHVGCSGVAAAAAVVVVLRSLRLCWYCCWCYVTLASTSK